MEASPALNDLKSTTCPNCGASLSYKPGTTNLTCEHCGSSFEIKTAGSSAEAQKENDLLAALSGNWQALQAQTQAYVVKCPACGAESSFDQNVFASACAFCGSPLSVKPDERSVAHPQAVLPFKIDRTAATNEYTKWLRKLWFAPNNLKKAASADRFNGVYLPFWTFDTDTQTDYRGERGEHYTETHTRMVNGKQEVVHETKTRWFPAGGRVQRFFNDILITASRAMPEKHLDRLEPWDLANLVSYDARYLSGFKAEVSQVNIADGYNEAKQRMERVIEQDVRRDIGGDEQRISSLNTRYDRQTYKYILLPVWLSVYRYGNKIYRFVVNARTGEVHGERPWSAWKIALAVIAALIVLGVVIYFVGQH